MTLYLSPSLFQRDKQLAARHTRIINNTATHSASGLLTLFSFLILKLCGDFKSLSRYEFITHAEIVFLFPLRRYNCIQFARSNADN